MRNAEDGRGAYSENNSDTESIASDRATFSGPILGLATGGNVSKKRASKKSARFNLPPEITMAKTYSTGSSAAASAPPLAAADNDDYVEITLDIRDDSVAVHSVTQGADGGHEDPELALLAKRTLESKSASFRSFLFNNASIKQVSQELKRVLSRRPSTNAGGSRFDRNKSAAAHALKGLKFITTKTGASGNGWSPVEKRFNDLTASSDGLLHRSQFAECIGTYVFHMIQTAKKERIIKIESFTNFSSFKYRDEPV